MNQQTKYGLEVSDIDNIIAILIRNKKISEIVLFGSRAKGNYSNGSDIDLAIKGDSIALNDIIDASIELDNLNLPYKIDLAIFERIKEQGLLEHIKRVGVVLFERNIT